MRHVIASLTTGACLLLAAAGTAFAGGGNISPTGTGQPGAPNNNCAPTNTTSPGLSAMAPGSAFNETPGGTAGGVYAGNGAPSLNGNQSKAIAQYDVACFKNQSLP